MYSNSIESENTNSDISNSENNRIVANNIVNRSIDENCINISNFLNSELCRYICDVIPII